MRSLWFLLCTSWAIATPPNVLLILTDDQGYGDLSIHGHPSIHTPNLDRLGEQGVRFDRFYVSSLCAPTRASLLTGRWSRRTGTYGVTRNREAMRPNEVTVARVLQNAGYRTACIGKWHNGEQYPHTPIGSGFDEFFGFTNGHINNYFDATLIRGSQPEKTEGYITDVLTDEAMRFIQKNRERPFFCYLAFNAPHSPYQVPDRYYDPFAAKGFRPEVAAFYGMCENLDDNVGRLLAHMESLGLRENTIVLFLTDNGNATGSDIYNSGMRGSKGSAHEGGSRVPLFIQWPTADWQPKVIQDLTAHVDLFPTLLDLCGIPLPEAPKLDGRSLRPLLEASQDAGWDDRVLFLHNAQIETNRYPGAVRTPKYRLVNETRGSEKAALSTWQLYDMDADFGQAKDIAKSHTEVVAELSALYETWFEDISSEPLARLPLPVGHAEHNPVELHAPQAFFNAPLRYAGQQGFAHDWLENWTSIEGKIWFDVDVARAGRYAVEVDYACAEEQAGSQLSLHTAAGMLEAVVPAAFAAELPLPHRDRAPKWYRDRTWGTLALGAISLQAGPQKLELRAAETKSSQVLEFKQLRLRYLEP